MKLSTRELVLLVSTTAVGLFGLTAILGRSKVDDWKQLRKDQQSMQWEIEKAQRMIESRPRWEGEFAELRALLPQFPADKRMDIHWLSEMDTIALKHGFRITRRQAGEPKNVGDVYELPIESREWEGPLDSLVYFLFDLQTEGGILDIRQLLVKPSKGEMLRGRFTLYCAYTKAEPPGERAGPGAAAPESSM